MLTRTMSRPFCGWRFVAVCRNVGMFANAFGLFTAAIYLHELVSIRGWPTGRVLGAITTFYVTSALLLIPVGSLIGRLSGRPSIMIGALAMGAGTAAIGRVEAPRQAYVAFFVLSFGWACLSLTAVAAPSTAVRPAGWTRRAALATWALQSVMLAFGLAMLVQVGFITHQVTLLSSALGAAGVSLAASGAALAALLGHLLLARFADHVSPRATSCALMGLTIGNVTTLSSIIVRREFGAATFGAVFGVASCGIQLAAAMGPSVYGLLHDAFGGYRLPLVLAGALDLVAAFVVLSRKPCKAARL